MRVQLICEDPSLTKQAFKDECDINRIMKKWLKTGVLTHVSTAAQTFRDVSQGSDYQDLMFKVIEVEDAFSSLPSDVRKKFRNDPVELLDFINDPKNTEEAVKLGLIVTDSTLVEGVKTVTEVAADAAPDS